GSAATSTTGSAGRARTSTGPGPSSACWRRCPGDRQHERLGGGDGRRLGHDRRALSAEEANAVAALRWLPVVVPHRRADRDRYGVVAGLGGEALPGEAALGVLPGDAVVLVEIEGAVPFGPDVEVETAGVPAGPRPRSFRPQRDDRAALHEQREPVERRGVAVDPHRAPMGLARPEVEPRPGR